MSIQRAAACRAFSLVELLVVVALVALLTGLLAPGIAGAREAGRTTACASNIRQLLLAATMYAGDHAERYPPGAAEFRRNLDRWFGSRASASGVFGAGGPLTAYLGEVPARTGGSPAALGVRSCPSFARTLDDLRQRGAGFERGCGGYGYNNAFVGTARREAPGGLWVVVDDRVGSRASRFATPSWTLAFGDAAFRERGAGAVEYSFAEPMHHPAWGAASRADPSLHFRHGAASAQVGWLDGHVSGERRASDWASGLYGDADIGVGWFTRAVTNAHWDYGAAAAPR